MPSMRKESPMFKLQNYKKKSKQINKQKPKKFQLIQISTLYSGSKHGVILESVGRRSQGLKVS